MPAVEIDIRKGGLEQVVKLVFADPPTGGSIPTAMSVVNYDQYVRVYDSKGGFMYVSKKDVKNMIKALGKAQELWSRN